MEAKAVVESEHNDRGVAGTDKIFPIKEWGPISRRTIVTSISVKSFNELNVK